MAKIILTQRILIEALRTSCHKYGPNDDAKIIFNGKGDIIQISHDENEQLEVEDIHNLDTPGKD